MTSWRPKNWNYKKPKIGQGKLYSQLDTLYDACIARYWFEKGADAMLKSLKPEILALQIQAGYEDYEKDLSEILP